MVILRQSDWEEKDLLCNLDGKQEVWDPGWDAVRWCGGNRVT